MANMVVETSLVTGARIFSLQATKDIQNGALVGKGDLVTGQDSIYTALDDYSDDIYLVANPEWSYDDSRTVNQNPENYINKANKPFRAYKIEKDMIFGISHIAETFEKDDTVKYDATTGKYVKDTSSEANLKVIDIVEVGFPFCVGSAGVKVTGDTTNEYGYASGEKVVKYLIERIK